MTTNGHSMYPINSTTDFAEISYGRIPPICIKSFKFLSELKKKCHR
jgi:hypothetical protein